MPTWLQRIEQAKKVKSFTTEDKQLAQLWTTDPISEVAYKIDLRNDDLVQGPTDIYLILNGIYFTQGVEKNDVQLAENCYNEIHSKVISDEDLHWLMVIFLYLENHVDYLLYRSSDSKILYKVERTDNILRLLEIRHPDGTITINEYGQITTDQIPSSWGWWIGISKDRNERWW